MARRDAERIEREKRLQATLADFFHAQGEVERIQAQAQTAATPFEAVIGETVRALDDLGETRTAIAELTGLPLHRVREYLADTPADPGHAGEPPSAKATGSARC